MKKQKIVEAIKYWSQVLLLPVYGLSFLIPRNKKIWVLGSSFGKRFADNPKYFYLYLRQFHEADINVVWISKNREIVLYLRENHYKAYYLYTFKGIWHCLIAKVYLYDNYTKDICFTLSGGAVKINMWHGIPLKKINMDNKFDPIRYPRNKLQKCKWMLRRLTDEKPSHYILVTADFLKNIFTSAFQTKNVIICGYPRNDILLSCKIRNLMFQGERKQYEAIQGCKKRVILYMPTFRESEVCLFDIIDFGEFQKYLEKEQLLFCIKLHFKSKIENRVRTVVNEFGNMLLINSEFDPYPFLKLADILITDYSSIYFDFLIKNKPIIFFNYDQKEYISKSRELYFDYDTFTPGKKVKTMKELEEAILQQDEYDAERRLIANLVIHEKEQCAGEELYHKICDILAINT